MFYFLLGGVSFALSQIAILIIKLFFPTILNNGFAVSILDYALSFIVIYCISTPIAFLAIKPLPKVKPIKEKMKFTHLLGAFCICFTCTDIGSSISSTLISIAEAITGKTLQNPVEATLTVGNFWLNAFMAAIFFPILEELLFRKLLCGRLLPLGEKQAIIISAAVFGLIHGNLFQFAYAFLFGLVLGYIYVKTGKIIYTIVFHCIINLYGGVFAQFVINKMPFDKLEEILNELTSNTELLNNPEALWALIAPYASGLALYMIYVYVMMGLAMAGAIVFLVALIKKKITFEQGILQTPKENRFSNFFLTGGVAAAIGFIVVDFLYSILQ